MLHFSHAPSPDFESKGYRINLFKTKSYIMQYVHDTHHDRKLLLLSTYLTLSPTSRSFQKLRFINPAQTTMALSKLFLVNNVLNLTVGNCTDDPKMRVCWPTAPQSCRELLKTQIIGFYSQRL